MSRSSSSRWSAWSEVTEHQPITPRFRLSCGQVSADELDFARTGPGTLAGRYLRRFWQPVSRACDLEPGQTKPIQVMSERFTLYRGEDGAPHLVAFRCAHRGTQMSTGWVEGDAIRCLHQVGNTTDPNLLNLMAERVIGGTLRLKDVDPDMSTYKMFWIEDYSSMVGQGAIPNREDERLGRNDAHLILFRRLWRRELAALRDGLPLKHWTTPAGLADMSIAPAPTPTAAL